MKTFYSLLLIGILFAIVLFASIIPAAADFPRSANLNLAPIPVQADNPSGGISAGLQRCSYRVSPSGDQTLTPLLDGTGIFQDLALNKITQIQPVYRVPLVQMPNSSKPANQTACTFSQMHSTG